jgi:RNA polymerase sigma-70 factor, ECF subfamily
MAVERAADAVGAAVIISPRGRGHHPRFDGESERWLAELGADHPRHDQAVTRLQALLSRVARHELARRCSQLGLVGGPEFDDLADQIAGDVLVSILAKLEQFEGLSRFTTWAYKFVVFEVSAKIAAHAWRRNPPSAIEPAFDHLPDAGGWGPEDRIQQREQLDLLAWAITQLTPRQREVFVAVALNEVPIDVLALTLGSNRNAVYKNLFDARRRLRQLLADAGYPIAGKEMSS